MQEDCAADAKPGGPTQGAYAPSPRLLLHAPDGPIEAEAGLKAPWTATVPARAAEMAGIERAADLAAGAKGVLPQTTPAYSWGCLRLMSSVQLLLS
eukprot:CAMPEP_0172606470 /NCGR_PEP_ID=MMETSP1068-20121228/26672_1 /TAXON_ID=35684 /ORGANISM="Pseudopedinella elastica, Strain CCMP716" /LENGTH=95 /DNA_ID=CAMNT_0013409179 /DNA_START=545 /DNA_END=830 /DNA_ORIENTATION=+